MVWCLELLLPACLPVRPFVRPDRRLNCFSAYLLKKKKKNVVLTLGGMNGAFHAIRAESLEMDF